MTKKSIKKILVSFKNDIEESQYYARSLEGRNYVHVSLSDGSNYDVIFFHEYVLFTIKKRIDKDNEKIISFTFYKDDTSVENWFAKEDMFFEYLHQRMIACTPDYRSKENPFFYWACFACQYAIRKYYEV